VWLATTSGIRVHLTEADKECKTSASNGLASNDVTPSLTHCQSIFIIFIILSAVPHHYTSHSSFLSPHPSLKVMQTGTEAEVKVL